MSRNSHIHKAGDGRGPRDVFVNDVLIKRVIYANTKKGVVKVYGPNLTVDENGKIGPVITLRGDVRVEMRAEA